MRACVRRFVTTGEIEIFIQSPAAHSSTSSHFFQSGPKTKPSGHIQNTLNILDKNRDKYKNIQNMYNIPLKGAIVISLVPGSMKMQNEFCRPPLSLE